MAAYNKFDVFVANIGRGKHDLAADVLKIMLTDTLPVVTNTTKANITDLAALHGYPAGGNAPAITSFGQTAGVLKLVLANTVFTASSDSIGPFRYVVLYDDTPTIPAKPLISWWDYGSEVTLANTETFTIDFDPTNGVLQFQ